MSYLPRMRTQLLAARSVAEALAEMAVDPRPAVGGAPIPEIAGPRRERLVEMATLLARRRGDPARVEAADAESQLWENGALLPGPHATLAGPMFADWLETAA